LFGRRGWVHRCADGSRVKLASPDKLFPAADEHTVKRFHAALEGLGSLEVSATVEVQRHVVHLRQELASAERLRDAFRDAYRVYSINPCADPQWPQRMAQEYFQHIMHCEKLLTLAESVARMTHSGVAPGLVLEVIGQAVTPSPATLHEAQTQAHEDVTAWKSPDGGSDP
jgi:hypothetical protein